MVGGYPLSDLIYPPSFSKRYTSKNMMKFWSNFAKTGEPGISSNSIKWKNISSAKESKYIMILIKKRTLKMASDFISFESLKY